MDRFRNRWIAWGLALGWLVTAGCDGDAPPGTDAGVVNDDAGPTPPAPDAGVTPDDRLSVAGTVVDFVTGDPIGGAASITAVGLNPPPTTSITGAAFGVDGVPPYSTFHLLAGSAPDHRNTYGPPIVVENASRDGLEARAVSEALVTQMSTAFGVTPAAGTGIVIGRAVHEDGSPYEGVSADAFTLAGARGPYFLGADGAPEPSRTETAIDGTFVFFDAPPGVAEIAQADGSTFVTSGAGPVSANAVTLLDATVAGEAPPVVENVSFARDVVPIFTDRGCTVCHSGGGIGRDQGGLTLGGSANLVYRELTEEVSPNHRTLRVDLADPPNSLVLTMPSLEDPPDDHPNAIFVSALDMDYQILLAWVREGALEN